MNALLIEDDAGIANFLVKGLAAEGYPTTVVSDGQTALRLASDPTLDVDLVLLDLGLPHVDGMDVLRALRANHAHLPIIVLTARDQIDEKVNAFDQGANDYVTKPFAFAELLARIRAAMRSAAPGNSTELVVGDLRLDVVTKIAYRRGRRIELAPKEWSLLEHLLRHPGQILSRQMLLNHVWGLSFDTTSNVVDVYIGYLRRKLHAPGESQIIETVRGAGYRLKAGDAPVEPAERRNTSSSA
jgi:DNA-binding response OmpR family regulator